MSSIYLQSLKLRAEHVDFRRRLRPSELMRLFQECCIAHTEELGMGRKMTLDRGFLWVIDSLHFSIERWPEYDEDITLRCYPGQTLHYFLPRYLEVLDRQGKVCIRATSLWSLIDEKTRSLIDPKENGIVIEGQEHGDEIAPAMGMPVQSLPEVRQLDARYSNVDINGHMNNAAYMDFIMDSFSEGDLENKNIKDIVLCFKKEIRLGQKVEVSVGKIKESYFAFSPYFSAKVALI